MTRIFYRTARGGSGKAEKDRLDGPAKRVCGLCPVRAECLEYAITHNQTEGVWGGMGESERASYRRKVRALRRVS